jgi:hypothetical protein
MISLIYAYYNNPLMLQGQYEVWASYPSDIKSKIELLIIDDGSFSAKDVTRPEGLPSIRIFEIQEDIPWNQDAARNIGAKEARFPWLIMSDMDHVFPASVIEGALARIKKIDLMDVGVFNRHRMDDVPLRPAPNVYLINRDTFWSVGGYDERLRGYYGTDVPYRKRLYEFCRKVGMPGCVMVYMPAQIPDCATRSLSRAPVTLPELDDNIVTLSSDYLEVML